MLRRQKDRAPSNDPIAGVSGGSVPDDCTDRPFIPGDSPPRDGGSFPTSVSDAMAAALVQILVGAK